MQPAASPATLSKLETETRPGAAGGHAAWTQTLQICPGERRRGRDASEGPGPPPGHHARLPQSPGKAQGPEDQQTLQVAWARPPPNPQGGESPTAHPAALRPPGLWHQGSIWGQGLPQGSREALCLQDKISDTESKASSAYL